MKKLGIIILFILLFGMWGLWYLGGPAVGGINQNSAITRATTPAELTSDEKLIALVRQSRAAAGRALLDPAGQTAPSAFRLTEQDLPASGGNDSESISRYGQAVIELFSAVNLNLTDPAPALKSALEALNEQAPAKTEAARQEAERYGRLAAGLRSLMPPNELKYVHLNLINAVLGLAEINSYLAEILTEPILALDQAQTLANRYERLADAIVIVNQVLAFHNLPLIAAL